MKKSLTILAIFIFALICIIWYSSNKHPLKSNLTNQNINSVKYSCDSGKTISATYSTNDISVKLSDGRELNLPQVVSGSGIRYEIGEGTSQNIVFLSKGNNAFITENNLITFSNCLSGQIDSHNGMNTFTDQGKTFSFTYPNMFTISGELGFTTNWISNNEYQVPGLVLAKATVDDSFEPKTNFRGTTVVIGKSDNPIATDFCSSGEKWQTVDSTSIFINDISFTKVTSTDAGAGNYYDTTSYKTLHNDQCYVVEYVIHTTNIGNYSLDQGIKEYDKNKIKEVLENIVKSFKFI